MLNKKNLARLISRAVRDAQAYLLFGDEAYLAAFCEAYAAVMRHLRPPAQPPAGFPKAHRFLREVGAPGEPHGRWVSSLSAFWPGLQALVGARPPQQTCLKVQRCAEMPEMCTGAVRVFCANIAGVLVCMQYVLQTSSVGVLKMCSCQAAILLSRPAPLQKHQHVLAGQLGDAEPLHADWMAAWHTFGGLPELFDAGLAMRHPLQRVRHRRHAHCFCPSMQARGLLAGALCVAELVTWGYKPVASTLDSKHKAHMEHLHVVLSAEDAVVPMPALAPACYACPVDFTPCHAAMHLWLCERGAAGQRHCG